MFTNHRVACVVFVQNDAKQVLLVKHPRRGWELPGGYVEVKESTKEAGRREVKEESGIDVQINELCGVKHIISRNLYVFYFTGIAESQIFQKSSETEAAQFVSLEEALLFITNKHNKKTLINCINYRTKPFFIEVV